MSELTTKHFKLFEESLQAVENPATRRIIGAFLIKVCKQNNKSFKEDKFRKNAGIE